ncbi:hypothetical protein B9N43_11615 [Denitratisoma sp. DHT3]|uniref:efflux RND transporter periplasmic adaptor subunit n=1 Tax=Denitratisoma sp. DHT3 TaxID=1981880 RepID=UPI0011986168|nr:efflux RND transporter periplasmic adaptor subunit [Denitratisoma sp. DHT3]QDX81840.1 hypothetical protein B9N43_11615 [Denitratisoma sp. DHT3]
MRPWLIPLLCVLLAACGKSVPAPEVARAVETVVVGGGAAASRRDYAGEVRARHEAVLSFRVGGKLLARLVDAGAQVRAGQPLARLDEADAAQQLAQAEAQRDLAAADLKRFRELRERNFVSPAALEAKEVAFRLAQAQATLARNQHAYATLKADSAGVVAAVLAEPGQVLAPGQPVLRLAPQGEREVAFQIPESERTRLHPGDAVQVTLWAVPGRVYRGRIREIAGTADAATRSYDARATLLDGDGAVGLGMTATVSLDQPQDGGLRLPHTAIFQQEPGKSGVAVWVVAADGAVSLRPVQVLRWSDDAAWVGAGLTAGERVVAAGVYKIHAGEKLRYADRRF